VACGREFKQKIGIFHAFCLTLHPYDGGKVKPMKFTYREDDISKNTSLEAIKHTHNQFINHHKTHTIALICEGLEENSKLVGYINSTHNWEICIHGWTHENYSLLSKQRIADDLDRCILKVEALFGVTPEKWYLPWNGWTQDNGFDLVARVADIALYHGVDVDTDCDHISHVVELLENGQNPVVDTIYFHGWDVEDLKLLPNLLYLTRKA